MLRRPYTNMYKLVTFFITGVYIREAFAFQSENLSTLCSCRYFYFGPTIYSRHFYRGTEHSIGKGYMQVIYHIQSFSLQFRMRFFFDEYNKITGRSTPLTRITSAAYIELHTCLHTSRHINSDGFFAIYPSTTFTLITFRCNGSTLSVTFRTSSNGLHLS